MQSDRLGKPKHTRCRQSPQEVVMIVIFSHKPPPPPLGARVWCTTHARSESRQSLAFCGREIGSELAKPHLESAQPGVWDLLFARNRRRYRFPGVQTHKRRAEGNNPPDTKEVNLNICIGRLNKNNATRKTKSKPNQQKNSKQQRPDSGNVWVSRLLSGPPTPNACVWTRDARSDWNQNACVKGVELLSTARPTDY